MGQVIHWWRYKSIWLLIIYLLSTFITSFLSVYFIPGLYSLIGIFLSCGLCGYLSMRNMSSVLNDIKKELDEIEI